MKQEEILEIIALIQNRKKQKRERIYEVIFVNVILVTAFIYFLSTIFVLLLFIFFLPIEISHYVSLLVYGLSLTLVMMLEYFFYKELLKTIEYSYENIYLFKKYTAICELFTVVFLSFLIGLSSPFFSLYNNELMKYFGFFVSASLAYLSCASAGTKCMLDYTREVWEKENIKHGNKLIG